MFKPHEIVEKARTSGFYMRILNWTLNSMIPFNKPHDFQIVDLGNHNIRVRLPYKRCNFNHIRGLHACALATVSEFATGFLLTTKLDAKRYRLIMRRLEMDYHYQGKMDAYAEFAIDDQWVSANVYQPLTSADVVEVNCEVKIYDQQRNHLTTGHVHWQIKDWSQVKTKIEN